MWNVCCQTPWQLYSGEFGFQFKYVQISGYPTGSFKNSAHHNPPCRLAPKNAEDMSIKLPVLSNVTQAHWQKKMFGTTAQRIATNIHSRWILLELTLTQQRNPSSSRSLRLHRSPHLFSDGRIVVALRILRPRGITDNCHGRTPWSSLGHCWNRFRRFNLATNLPSDLWETEKYMSWVMDVMVFARENPVGSPIPAGCSRIASGEVDLRASSWCSLWSRKKSTQNNCSESSRLHCLKSTTKVQKVWWCLMNFYGKDESSYCGGCVTFQDMCANWPD